MKYEPWLPGRESDRQYFAEFLKIGKAFHAGELSRDALAAWHERSLADVLEHAAANSPFYKRHLAGVDLSAVTVDGIAALPFTTKEHLRTEMLNMISGSVRDALYYFQTTGTTGPATPCPRDARESVVSNFNVAMSMERILRKVCGPNAKPIVAVLVPNEMHSACKTITDVCKDLGVTVFDAFPGSPVIGTRACIDVLKNLQVDAVVAPPGVMLTVAKYAQAVGMNPAKDFGLKAILTTGEICTKSMAANLKTIWDCQTFDFIYGSQEAFVIGAAAESGELVAHLPNYILELIDPVTGQSSRSGRGELCLTTLVPGVKPLIRYRTGDIAELSFDPSAPAAASSRIRVLGRINDQIRVGKGRITAAELEELALEGAEHCAGYQYRVSKGESGEDQLQLSLEFLRSAADRFDADNYAQRARARLSARLEAACSVEIVRAVDATASVGAWVSWKAARFLDQRESQRPEKRAVDDAERAAARQLAGSTAQKRN